MAEVMAQLGSFQFSIDTAAFQSMRRARSYRWPSQDRLTRRPARQFVGPGEENVSLSGVVYPGEIGGSADPIQALRDLADAGKPQRLIASPQARTGVILGLWVILKVDETGTLFLPGGKPRKVEFTIDLSHYGDNQSSASESGIRPNGFSEINRTVTQRFGEINRTVTQLF